jgi:hypothetical protein
VALTQLSTRPSTAAATRPGAVIVLQHPFEHKRALATVPLLEAALQNIWVRARSYRSAAPCVVRRCTCEEWTRRVVL